jgi:hypothetical protein
MSILLAPPPITAKPRDPAVAESSVTGKRAGGLFGDVAGRPALGQETALPDYVLAAKRQSAGDDAGGGGNATMRFRFDALMLGENLWTSNHLRFADEHAALVHARGMFSRWIVIEKMRIAREGAPKGEPYVSGSEHPDWAGPRVEVTTPYGSHLRLHDRQNVVYAAAVDVVVIPRSSNRTRMSARSLW